MKYERIVVAIDLSSESTKILDVAASIAGKNLSAVHAIHVVEPMAIYPYEAYIPDMQKVKDEIGAESKKQLREHADRINIPASNQQLLMGPPASDICRYAAECDAQLIVLGSHGVSGWRVLLGSTANSVIQEAKCDVLTVRVGLDTKE
tara:strand:+ start:325 stop:768 length:444 start_codon:yes stop_codon:yes gene_type:complete